MLQFESNTAGDGGTALATLRFTATDVTGTNVATAEVQQALSPAVVTKSLVVKMSLPDDVPYALRDDATGEILTDDRPIGEQLAPDSSVTVTPRTHLGSR